MAHIPSQSPAGSSYTSFCLGLLTATSCRLPCAQMDLAAGHFSVARRRHCTLVPQFDPCPPPFYTPECSSLPHLCASSPLTFNTQASDRYRYLRELAYDFAWLLDKLGKADE